MSGDTLLAILLIVSFGVLAWVLPRSGSGNTRFT